MLIQMLETRTDTEDGFSLRTFKEGETYQVRDYLARDFIWHGRAKCVDPQFQQAGA